MVYSATMPQIYDAHENKKITIGDSCDDNINKKPSEAFWYLRQSLSRQTGITLPTNAIPPIKTQQWKGNMYVNVICWSIHNDYITLIMVRVVPDWVHCDEDWPSDHHANKTYMYVTTMHLIFSNKHQPMKLNEMKYFIASTHPLVLSKSQSAGTICRDYAAE